MLGFRYQPVIQITELNGVQDIAISLVEVYLNDDDTLSGWTECLNCAPKGNDIEDLCKEISHMWMAAMCWKPVLASDLKPGMKFERTVSMEERNRLADFIEGGGAFLRSKPVET